MKELSNYHSCSPQIIQCGVDLLLNDGNIPKESMLECLNIVIKESIFSPKCGIEIATKWVRVIMSLTLPSKEDYCEGALLQLKEALALRKNTEYPVHEVQWIGNQICLLGI